MSRRIVTLIIVLLLAYGGVAAPYSGVATRRLRAPITDLKKITPRPATHRSTVVIH